VTDRLALYATAKQYQLQADRAYGWVFNDDGSLEDTFYLSSVAQKDSVLDRLVTEMKLNSVGQPLATIPPSARRATKRMKKAKRASRAVFAS
jgi:hypothetical protein